MVRSDSAYTIIQISLLGLYGRTMNTRMLRNKEATLPHDSTVAKPPQELDTDSHVI